MITVELVGKFWSTV